MVIQWDLDGVLANFTKAYHGLANEMFNADVTLTEPPTWDWLEDQIGKKSVGEIWQRIKTDPQFWSNLEPLVSDDIIARIQKLEVEHDYVFVTSRPGIDTKTQTESWIRHHFGFNGTVIVSDRKADAANACRANYVIDDKAGNAIAVYYMSPKDRKTYLLDTPYNQFSPEVMGRGIRRIATVGEFLDDIEAGR